MADEHPEWFENEAMELAEYRGHEALEVGRLSAEITEEWQLRAIYDRALEIQAQWRGL